MKSLLMGDKIAQVVSSKIVVVDLGKIHAEVVSMLITGIWIRRRLRVMASIIWGNLPRWIVYVALKLTTMHLTNSVTFKFNGKDYFAKLMQR